MVCQFQKPALLLHGYWYDCYPVKTPNKLIGVALPLVEINAAPVREKSIRHGHPSTPHLWWARRPLAAARAVLFAQLVKDPGHERSLQRGMRLRSGLAICIPR
jgi:putative DNA methylase